MAIQPTKAVSPATDSRTRSQSSVKATTSLTDMRRWPAEWEPQSAIWLAYPHRQRTWPRHLTAARDAFAQFANTASEHIHVNVLAQAGSLGNAARKALSANIELHDIPTNDTWLRDYGPTFVHSTSAGSDRKVIGINWHFNAWGGKFRPWDDDDAAASLICRRIGVTCENSRLTLEGGAIEGDGQGRLLTTPICLENANRNPGWTRDKIANELHKRLGVTEIVWVDGGGLEGDDTDGHIDQLARFVTPTDVVVAVSSVADDPNAAGLRCNHLQVSAWAEQDDTASHGSCVANATAAKDRSGACAGELLQFS